MRALFIDSTTQASTLYFRAQRKYYSSTWSPQACTGVHVGGSSFRAHAVCLGPWKLPAGSMPTASETPGEAKRQSSSLRVKVFVRFNAQESDFRDGFFAESPPPYRQPDLSGLHQPMKIGCARSDAPKVPLHRTWAPRQPKPSFTPSSTNQIVHNVEEVGVVGPRLVVCVDGDPESAQQDLG